MGRVEMEPTVRPVAERLEQRLPRGAGCDVRDDRIRLPQNADRVLSQALKYEFVETLTHFVTGGGERLS